jgi:hypothetical protein
MPKGMADPGTVGTCRPAETPEGLNLRAILFVVLTILGMVRAFGRAQAGGTNSWLQGVIFAVLFVCSVPLTARLAARLRWRFRPR